MARRKRGKKGSKAVPAIQAAIVAYPLVAAYKETGLTSNFPNVAIYNLTGFSAAQGKMIDPAKPVAIALALLAASTIGAKLANKTGANRMMKKLTGGMVKLA